MHKYRKKLPGRLIKRTSIEKKEKVSVLSVRQVAVNQPFYIFWVGWTNHQREKLP